MIIFRDYFLRLFKLLNLDNFLTRLNSMIVMKKCWNYYTTSYKWMAIAWNFKINKVRSIY